MLRARGAANASIMTIRRNEGGLRSPSLEEIGAMADLCAVPVAWLAGGSAGDRADDPLADERRQILAHFEAELTRATAEGRPGGARTALERVDARLQLRRARGELPEAGWAYWVALRTGAQLALVAAAADRSESQQ